MCRVQKGNSPLLIITDIKTFFRRATAAKNVKEPTGGDMEIFASWCRRRSGRRGRQRSLERKCNEAYNQSNSTH